MRGYPKSFYALLFGWMFSAFGFASLLPFLSVFLASEFNLSASGIGIFFLATALGRGIIQVYAGEFSDIIGRKNIIVFSQILRSIFLLIVAQLLYIKFKSQVVIVLIAISYVFASMFQPLAQAALSDHIPIDNFINAFSLIRMAGNLSWAVAPILAGYSTLYSFAFLFLISGIFSAGCAAVIGLNYAETGNKDSIETRLPILEIFKDNVFLIFCFISFLLMITISQMFSSLGVFLSEFKKLDNSKIGYIFAINGLTVFLFQVPISKFLKRYLSPLRGMAIGAFLYATGYSITGLSDSIPLYILILFCISFGEVFVIPLTQTAVAKLAPENMTGRYMGFFSMVSVAGWSLGPYIGGLILDNLKQRIVIAWLFIALFAFCAACGYLILEYFLKRSKFQRNL